MSGSSSSSPVPSSSSVPSSNSSHSSALPSSSGGACLQWVQFEITFSAPTDGQTIWIPAEGSLGPQISGSVNLGVKWCCPPPTPDLSASWVLYWNSNPVDWGDMTIAWTGSDGTASASPTYTPNYTSANVGSNAYKIVVTQDDTVRRKIISATVAIQDGSSSSPMPTSSSSAAQQ